MRRRRQFEMAWNDDYRLQLVDWNAKHARRSFTVVVVLVYWAALWPLVAAGYCHNRSSKLDAAAAAAAEEKLLTSEECPETQNIKKRRQEGTTRRQREHYWPSVDRDKNLCCRKGQKEEQVEGGGGGGWGGRGGAAIAKTKSTDRLLRRSGEGKAQDGRYESPRHSGDLASWLARLQGRSCVAALHQEERRTRLWYILPSLQHPSSFVLFINCSAATISRESRLSFGTLGAFCMFVCFLSCANELSFGAIITGRFWSVFSSSSSLSLGCLSDCRVFSFVVLFLYFDSLLPSPKCAPFKFRKARSFTSVESRIACARVGHKVHTINGGGSPLQVSLLFCFSSLLFACCYRATTTTTTANSICCKRDNNTTNNNKRIVVASFDRFFEVTTVQVSYFARSSWKFLPLTLNCASRSRLYKLVNHPA